MSRCACPPHGRWYCNWCADLGVLAGLALPRQHQAPPRLLPATLAQGATEEELRARLHAFATALGYLHYHTRDSRKSAAGWPDDALVHPGGGTLFLWELKRQGSDSQPSGAQQRWLDALGKVTAVHAGLYRPSDWPEMQELLTKRGTP